MKRKIIALLLILTLILSSVPVLAQNSQKNTGVSSFLSYIGIGLPADEVDIEDIERPAKKAEIVYLVVQAMGKNAYVDKEYLTFPDVKLDSWYHDNVILGATKGLVYGHEDGFFGVDDEIDEQTAAIIMLRALGFGMLPGASKSDNLAAIYSGASGDLLKGTSRDGTVTLAEAYRMVYNMLLSDYVALNLTDAINSYHVETDKIYMQDAFDIRKETGRVTGNEYTSLGLGGGGVGKSCIEIDGIRYDTALDNTTEYLGFGVDYFIDESTGEAVVLYMIPEDRNEITEILSTNLYSCDVSGSDIVLKYEEENGSIKYLRVPLGCDFVYNGKAESFTAALVQGLINNKLGSVKIVEYREQVVLSVTAYDTMIVDTISSYDEVIYGRYGVAPVSVEQEDGEFIIIEKDGVIGAISDISKDDVIQVASTLDGRSKKILICSYTLTGAVTSGVSDGEIAIDGTTYPVSNYFILNRQANVNLQLGLKQKFLFNTLGELVDVVEDSAEYVGEHVFLIDVKNMSDIEEHLVRVKYVTMDAAMITAYFGERVRYNGTRAYAEDVVTSLLPTTGGVVQRRIIYIEKNSEGEISVINTPEQKDASGVYNENDVVTRDALEKKRKCKQTSAWLVDTNDANFPEFYTDADTKILMVPTSSSNEAAFMEKMNYEKKTSGFFQDAKDYIVEGYNLDEYNVAGIMLLRQEQSFNSQMSNNNLVLVTSVGSGLSEDDEVVPVIKGYQDGAPVEIKLKDNSVLNYSNRTGKRIKANDVCRFNVDSGGYAIHSEYFKNVLTDCAITDYPEGQNNGNAIVIGRVVSQKDNYLRLKFTENAAVKERVFRGTMPDVTIYEGNMCYKGTAGDLLPGSLVLIRVFYTTLHDIIVIK